MLHPFTDQFTNQSGASILQHFTFEQKKTKIAQVGCHLLTNFGIKTEGVWRSKTDFGNGTQAINRNKNIEYMLF